MDCWVVLNMEFCLDIIYGRTLNGKFSNIKLDVESNLSSNLVELKVLQSKHCSAVKTIVKSKLMFIQNDSKVATEISRENRCSDGKNARLLQSLMNLRVSSNRNIHTKIDIKSNPIVRT